MPDAEVILRLTHRPAPLLDEASASITAPFANGYVSGLEAPSSLPLLLLAGGLGTRLRPLTGQHPKVLAEVAPGLSMLAYLLDHWRLYGGERLVVSIGYGAEPVEAACRKWSELRITPITIVREEVPLGTGGAVRHALASLGSRFFVANADTVLRVHLGAVARWCARRGFSSALVVAPHSGKDADTVEIDDTGSVRAFTPRGTPGFAHTGLALLTADWFRGLEVPAPFNLERDVIAPAIASGARLGAARTRRSFHDLGTPERLAAFQGLLAGSANE